MEFAADFTAIDFETASRRHDSACQLGLATVRQGQIIERVCWLIRPKPLYFHRANIQIHGITPEQVRDKPEFGELWPEISERIGDDCLVAHNAAFDLRVLIGALQSHRHPIPELRFTCTRAIARRTWPHLRRYGLKPLSNWLGIRFRHHDALEDAVACAKILLAAGIDREATSLPDLERRLRLRTGKAGSWGLRTPSGSSRRRPRLEKVPSPSTAEFGLPFLLPDQLTPAAERVRSTAGVEEGEDTEAMAGGQIDLQRLMIRAEFIRPLAGVQVVLAGKFRMLSAEQARDLADRSGAVCKEQVDDKTDFMVVDEMMRSQAEKEADTRGVTRVISEREFLRLVDSPSSVR
jgi:DNA polymerase-3 subunit epsilon